MHISGKRREFASICKICKNRMMNVTGECSPSGVGGYSCSCMVVTQSNTTCNFYPNEYHSVDDVCACDKFELDEKLVKEPNEITKHIE